MQVGDVAPSFSLLDLNNNLVNSDQFPGKRIILFFYPMAMTPGCTKQACSWRDSFSRLPADCVVFGVSKDQPDKLKEFKEKHSMQFDLLSDPKGEMMKKYGVISSIPLINKTALGTQRYTIVLKDGKVIYCKKTGTNNSEVIDWLLANNE